MPKKKHVLSDEERRKRLRETARALETSDDPKEFDRAFKKVVQPAKVRVPN
jgi:hypothetical protein